MNLTDEQASILEEIPEPGNVQLIAYAGCGKSTTLQLFDKKMEPFPRLYLAFNKKIVKDMEERDEDGKPKLRPTTKCMTLNSLGHRTWANTCAKTVKVNLNKTVEIFREYAKGQPADVQSILWEEFDEIRRAVDLAKAYGWIPEGMMYWDRRLVGGSDFMDLIDEPIHVQSAIAVDAIVRISIKRAYQGDIDFNDQLYMPTLFGGSFSKYDFTFVDEYQDLSPINHEMVAKVTRSGRLLAAGDPFQSIYAFRGAMQNGMKEQLLRFEMKPMPLSVSFRCPQKVVENARWRAKNFQWLKPGGTVRALSRLSASDIPDGSAIICRNNAPLFKLAISLLSRGRSVSMAGTDIGTRLCGILRRLGDSSLSRSAVLDEIGHWEEKRAGSRTAADVAECLRIFANLGSTLGDALAHAEALLKQTGTIHLTTGHKAKGLEWDVVYHLDPHLIGDEEQELNLRYVIQTRSRDQYYEIESAAIS